MKLGTQEKFQVQFLLSCFPERQISSRAFFSQPSDVPRQFADHFYFGVYISTSNGSEQERENGNLSYPDLRSAFPIVKYTNHKAEREKRMNKKMKIAVIGGTGLIGTRVVNNLRHRGQEVVAASPSSGVNTFTGEGLAEALTSAQVVVDVANAPSWEDNAVMEFFQTAGRNLLAAEKAAGIRHHVALSIVGADRLPASGYLRAKVAQENLIKTSGIPFTIVRSTQFFGFVKGIIQSATEGETVRLSPALMQPIAADDVAAALSGWALAKPLNGTVEIAGPEPIRMDEFAQRFLSATRDPRKVIPDVHFQYFGTELDDQSLTPGNKARLAPTRFEEWLSRPSAQRAA
jgi:uncharacterized protein YbjT (DUF2867 family)